MEANKHKKPMSCLGRRSLPPGTLQQQGRIGVGLRSMQSEPSHGCGEHKCLQCRQSPPYHCERVGLEIAGLLTVRQRLWLDKLCIVVSCALAPLHEPLPTPQQWQQQQHIRVRR